MRDIKENEARKFDNYSLNGLEEKYLNRNNEDRKSQYSREIPKELDRNYSSINS